MNGDWHNCFGHDVDYRELDGCPVCELSAEVAALEAKLPQWQPIETAPKDATEILVWADGRGCAVVTWMVEGYAGPTWQLTHTGSYAEDSEVYWPTHWMPLPEPPK